jgi:hypothetical protein
MREDPAGDVAIRPIKPDAADDSGGGPVVVLVCAQVVRVNVVALHTPGEILEEEFVVHPPADVYCGWVVEVAARVHPLDAAQAMNKGAPLPESYR